MRKILIKLLSVILLIGSLISVMVVSSSAAIAYPDGGTTTTYDHLGSDKKATFYFKKRDGTLLRTFIMYGPKGEYYVDTLSLWGYTPYKKDFPWHLMVSAEITSMADNCVYQGQAFSTQIGVKFTQLLSPDEYEGTVWLDPDTCDVTIRHILVGADGSESLYDSNTLTYTYGTLFGAYSKSIAGYDLDSRYKDKIYENFTWDLVGGSANIPEENYSAKFHPVTGSTEGNDRCYYDTRKLNVDFKYKIKSYTITYDADGGTGAPESQTKYYGTNINLSTDIPTKEGYSFAGWSYSPDDDTAEYYPGETYTSNSNLSLYAVWQHSGYAIKYNANGGTGAPATQYKKQGEILTLRSTKPTREGYRFTGWATTPGPVQAVKYSPGGQYWLDEPATLYAVWVETTPTYTVSFDANGGNGAPVAQTKTKGTDLTLSTKTPSRSGYTFAGWSTSSTASSPTYYPGGKYTADASATLYAVWVKAPSNYTVSYNANGGSGAPSSQIKTENVSLTLSSTTPTRSGYKFLGWSTSSTATSATYQPGDVYTVNASIMLYAVWRKDNYDISVSNLTVNPSTVEQYSDTSVSVRVDNWCQNKPYYNIPVELLYNGNVVASKTINLSTYGVATVNFTLNVGKPIGDNILAARVNWSDRNNETDPNDNYVTTYVDVTPYKYDLYIAPIAPNASYREGTEVITSFVIFNDGEYDILPENNNSVKFTAYYYDDSGTKRTITTKTLSEAVIPAKNTNLVYFKWTVPEGLAGKTVYISGTVNSIGGVSETDTGNNTTEFTMKIIGAMDSQPTDTSYTVAPEGYAPTAAPSKSYGTATWNQWIYASNGELVLAEYGIGISTNTPTLLPSDNVMSAIKNGSNWTIKSGYGIKINYTPALTTLSGYAVPSSDAYTSIQTVYAMFPEFGYASNNGCIATLVKNGNTFEFVPNENSKTEEPVHFIPLWMQNGQYVVPLYVGEVWTPAGMIYSVTSATNMSISGTLYDDFYVGEQ